MKRVILEADIIKLNNSGIKVLPVGKGDIITPLASDRIKSSGIVIVSKEETEKIEASKAAASAPSPVKYKKIAIGSDHTGVKIKAMLSAILAEKGFDITDVGTYTEESCDYPDFALSVALNVREQKADFGILIDATGIPSAIAANKVPGIRAATCYNEFSARSAREHNNANVLVMGAKALGEESIKSILEVWLSTFFGGGRHQKRLSKITAIEERFSR